ncbi:MAG TPA: type II toxin-antitoxin system mRNA interferase toxin, RelE/StbE family [Candidatus Paceibacterota bacterium]|nr:type II toxin-antitoxin system mRNA interferase toxin, RelE/StbE family [Candidatus Paceibacterota bacterium]
MRIQFHKRFIKQHKNLKKIWDKFDERFILFTKDPNHPLLNNHPLHGKYDNYRSINITGDIRAVYKEVNKDLVIFIALGTHSELYS